MNKKYIKIYDIPDMYRLNYIFYIKSGLFGSVKNSFKIVQLNKDYYKKSSYDTIRIYTKCCYDNKNNCIWAIGDNSRENIYKLDISFREIETIKIKKNVKNFGKIRSICYDYNTQTVIACYDHNILYINKYGDILKDYKNKKLTITSCTAYKDGKFISHFKNNQSYIIRYDNNEQPVENIEAGKDIYIYNMDIVQYKNKFFLCAFIIKGNCHKKVYHIPI